MTLDTSTPFRGSDAVRCGDLTRGKLLGPGFRKLGYDVYVAADVPDSPLLPVRAALCRGGPDAVATGWSACVALGLDVARGERPVEVAVPDRQLSVGPGLVSRRQRFTPDEVTVRDGVRTTTALRTTFDLACRSGPVRSDVERVIDPLTDAVVAADALARLGGFTSADLEDFARSRRKPGGPGRVARVVSLLDPRPDSPPETRARVKIVLHGLPRPLVRFGVRDEWAGRGYELDLAWPEFMVALEYDGKDHAKADRRGRDIDRLETLARLGWTVIVVTAPQLRRPRWVPERVGAALSARGWVPGPNPWEAVWAENQAANRESTMVNRSR